MICEHDKKTAWYKRTIVLKRSYHQLKWRYCVQCRKQIDLTEKEV